VIVVDTNIIGYLYLTSKWSGEVERALLKDPEWAAPLLWRSEFRNVLATYFHEGLIALEDARQFIEEAEILSDQVATRKFLPVVATRQRPII